MSKILQVIKWPLKGIYQRLVRRLAGSLRVEMDRDLHQVREQLALTRKELRSSLDVALADIWQDLQSHPDSSSGGQTEANELAARTNSLLAEVKAELTQTTQSYIEFQLVMTQQLADEITRLHKKIDDLRAGAPAVLLPPSDANRAA